MKKLSILALAAVGLLVGACSTKDVVEDVAGGTMDGKGKGYLNVNINLPTQPEVSTRGWQESPMLDDGSDIEYAVDNVLLAVFGGTSESTATLQQVVTKATNWNTNDDNPKQITKTSDNIVFKLNDDVTGKLFVLAMLNYTDVVTPNVANGTLAVGQTNITTLATLQRAMSTTTNASTNFRNANNRFFMTNAVLSDLESGNEGLNTAGHAKVLAPVTHIYESETEAQAANATPSAEIFVERGLAKVTIDRASSSSAITVNGDVTDADGVALATATLNGWVLDNTNKKSYIVRNTYTDSQWGMFSDYAANQANDRFRFVGVNPVKPAGNAAGPSSSLYYRSYWAFDPNYSDDAGTGDFYEPSNKTFATGNDMANPQYCFENTFSVLRQTYKNTTRVVLAVKFNDGNDFYTFNNDRKTLYKQDDLKDEAAKALMLNSTFKTWFQGKGGGATLNGGDVTVVWKKDRAGLVKVASFKIKIGTADAVDYTDATVITAINAALGTINRYKDGIAYYAIRIKHFGDDLTPWGGNGEKESGINDIYPGSTSSNAEELAQCDKRYLGRYGVLRNNWYLLSLGSIAKLGHPIVPWLQNDPTDPNNPDTPDNPQDPDNPDPNPEKPDHPDDSLDDTYLSAKIHILSWAKRPQGVILK